MRYLLFPDGVGLLATRGSHPLGQRLTLSFPDIKRGKLFLADGEELSVTDGRVSIPARLLREGENSLTLKSDNAAPTKWRLESLCLSDGRLTPLGVDTTALLLRLYEEQKQHKEAIAELRRASLYFQSKIDGNSLF